MHGPVPEPFRLADQRKERVLDNLLSEKVIPQNGVRKPMQPRFVRLKQRFDEGPLLFTEIHQEEDRHFAFAFLSPIMYTAVFAKNLHGFAFLF